MDQVQEQYQNQHGVPMIPIRKRYAGIGSRDISEEIAQRIIGIASYLRGQGLTCVSGGAIGSDTAFEIGARELFEKWRPADATVYATEIAENIHPEWESCDRYAKKLHARNSMILLGADCESPVEFCVAYTPGGKLKGGTAQGLRIAKAFGIPVYNLGLYPDEGLFHFREWYKQVI